MKTDSVSNQLRWVILLLAAAVILPTVCLLWFMNQAVKNVTYSARQNIVDFYQQRIHESVVKRIDQITVEKFDVAKLLGFYSEQMAQETFRFFIPSSYYHEIFDGFVVYNSQGQREWPVTMPFEDETDFYPSSEPFMQAWKEEFEHNDPNAATLLYQRIIVENQELDDVLQIAQMGLLRCLTKTHRWDEAITLAHQLSQKMNTTQSRTILYLQSSVQLAELYKKTNDEKLTSFLKDHLISPAYYQYHDRTVNKPRMVPTQFESWTRSKLIEIAKEANLEEILSSEIETAKKLIHINELSMETAESLTDTNIFTDWPEQTIRITAPEEPVYGMYYNLENSFVLCLIRPARMKNLFESAVSDTINDDMVKIQIIDPAGHDLLENTRTQIQPDKILLSLPLGRYLPDWSVQLSFQDNDLFEEAAQRQKAIYIWTGLLVAVLILLAGTIAIRSVNHQIKMNRLKNDFIATVTHELKTPLASMRLLVDTLLEGNYHDEQTATEYLQLVANENKRLTHLIDSFLTFSRMERNKQVFDFQPTQPEEIVTAAVEAMQAKFSSENCRFNYTIAENLHSVTADIDGMVTVLVNLLDNAYKYTNGDKQIELNVYEQNGSVCFAVKDNGIGLSPRAQKKIFNRFYQADSRLSRRAEGCGLGLSIVKFIVDAHKGTINVESKVNDGSTFIVKLPCIKES